MKTIMSLQLTAICLTAALTAPISAVGGEDVPFIGSIEGSFTTVLDAGPPPIGHVVGSGMGNASQLGHFTYDIDAHVNFGTVPPLGTGTYTFTAANGDTLVADFVGYSTPVEPGVVWVVDEAVITSGTGRFAGASGELTITRLVVQSSGTTSGGIEGTISTP